MRARDGNIRVAQRLARSVDAMFGADLAAVLFPQRVQRTTAVTPCACSQAVNAVKSRSHR